MHNVKNIVKRYLSLGKTKDAFHVLLGNLKEFSEDEQNQIISLSGRYEQWKSKSILGINENDIELRKIGDAILDILSREESHSKTSISWYKHAYMKYAGIALVSALIVGIGIFSYSPKQQLIVNGNDNIVAGRDLTYNQKTEQIIETVLPKGNEAIADDSLVSSKICVLVVHRDNSIWGMAMDCFLEINDGTIGAIKSKETKTIRLKPLIKCKLISRIVNGNYGNELQFAANEGDSLFVELSNPLYRSPKLKFTNR